MEGRIIPTTGIGHLPGVRRIRKVAAPAAGAEWTTTLADGYYYRLLTGQATFTTGAAVANRFPGISLSVEGVTVFTIEAQAAIVASTTATITYVGGALNQPTAANTPDVQIGAPGFWMEPAHVLSSITPGLAAADQYSAVVLWLEMIDHRYHQMWEEMADHGRTIERSGGL